MGSSRRSTRSLSGAVLLLAIASGCAGGEGQRPSVRRVVIVDAPGLSWALVSPLLASGRLPVMARLYREGSAGILVSPEPLAAEVIGTTLATGAPPSSHGIGRSVERIPGGYALRPAGADRRRVPAIWGVAGAMGLVVGVGGWPGTFPAEAVKGFMLAAGAEPGERGWLSPPEALGSDGAGREPLEEIPIGARLAGLDPALAESVRGDLEMLGRSLTLTRVYQPGLLMLHLASVDRAAHRFWRHHDPRYQALAASRGLPPDDPERAAALSHAVTLSIEFVDACLGLLMQRLPERTALLVVSSWGARGVVPTDYLDVDLNLVLEKLGFLSRDGQGRIEWPRTAAFALGDEGQRPRALYLNVAGREEAGVVPAGQAAARRQEIAHALASLSTAAGQPLFLSATPVAEPEPGAADIEVVPNAEIDPGDLLPLGGRQAPVISCWRRWSDDFGAHDPAGILIASGDGVPAGRTGFQAGALQLAPTALSLLGLPWPSSDGAGPIREILAKGDRPAAGGSAPIAANVAPGPVRRGPELVERALERMRDEGHLARRPTPP